MSTQERNLLFVSHANPEDNRFAQWLSLQLARRGYRVWCDLTRLLGGEDFWRDIELAIRNETGKLLYVLSRPSNVKTGTLQELHLGQSVARTHELKDFVIPLRVDDIPHGDINIQLSRINAIDFRRGWAEGLRALVEKLEQDGVSKDTRYSPESVALWWRRSKETDLGVARQPDEYLSNWFAIRELPHTIHIHRTGMTKGQFPNSWTLPYPARRHGEYLVSFASLDDLLEGARANLDIVGSDSFDTNRLLNGIHQPIKATALQGHNITMDLLRQGWERLMQSKGMSRHLMGTRRVVGFLKHGQIPNNRVLIPKEFGGGRYRTLVGYRSRRSAENTIWQRFWHFAIGCTPTLHPYLGYKVIPHILFSDDGKNIWTDSNRLHRIRRRESRNWWNAEWRDRTLGLMTWLAGENGDISVVLSSEAAVQVETHPIRFVSPVSYVDPDAVQSLDQHVEVAEESDYEEDGW